MGNPTQKFMRNLIHVVIPIGYNKKCNREARETYQANIFIFRDYSGLRPMMIPTNHI